jgi:hypothetical protein
MPLERLVPLGCAPFFITDGKENVAMAEKSGPGMFFGPGTEVGNEGQRIIFVLVNRLSVFLKTKREVNRAINEIRFLLKKRVRQRLNAEKKKQSTSDT